MSRRAITRPASRRFVSALAPSSSGSASARTAAISSRSGNRFGSGHRRARVASRGLSIAGGSLRRLDVHDLELQRAARRGDLDRLALLLAHDRLADGRLVRQLVLGGVRLGGADDVVLDRLARPSRRGDAPWCRPRPRRVLISFFVMTRALRSRSSSIAMRASRWACSFFAVSYSAFSAMSPNSRRRGCGPRSRGACRSRGTRSPLELLAPVGCENDFLQDCAPPESAKRRRLRDRRPAGAMVPPALGWTSTTGGVPFPADAGRISRNPWWIGDVEIPTRLVLAPMAGVSVQAFRRQGRRYGAGLVCSEMVSCAGIEHRNERTLGYLRVASDEHPLAIQIFGSEPRAMARPRAWSRRRARTSSTSTSAAPCAR